MRKVSFIATFIFVMAALVYSQTVVPQSRVLPYPDFALQAPPINTNPGPEYAPSTRAFQGVPAIELTAKGRLWAAWSVGNYGSPHGHVVLVTSGDTGKSWSEPTIVIDPPGNVNASDEALWSDPLGRLWLFWRQAYGRRDGRDGVWAIVSENPEAEKPSWSRPQRLADGKALNKPIVLSSGEWLLPVAVEPYGSQRSTTPTGSA